MRKTIRFQLEGQTYQVEVERDGDLLTVSREGESYTVELLADAPAAPPAASAAQPAAGSAPGARPAPADAAAKVSPAPGSPDQPGTLYAPMTGLIKEVKVKAGSSVAKGEVVLVMEAMKMDVEVSAPASGVVAQVNVSAGETVEAQKPLLLILG